MVIVSYFFRNSTGVSYKGVSYKLILRVSVLQKWFFSLNLKDFLYEMEITKLRYITRFRPAQGQSDSQNETNNQLTDVAMLFMLQFINPF